MKRTESFTFTGLILSSILMFSVSLASCDDEENAVPPTVMDSGSGGTIEAGPEATSSGGSGGSTGTGGSAGNVEATWPKGQIGIVDRATTLSSKSGRLQGFDVKPKGLKTMGYDTLGNEPDADVDAPDESGVPAENPETAPKVDTSGVTVGYDNIRVPITPYLDEDGITVHLPLVLIVNSDDSVSSIRHFTLEEAKEEFSLASWNVGKTEINGKTFGNYVGLSVNLTECNGGHYFVTNGGDKVWKLEDDGSKSILASGLVGPSAIVCHPEQYLLVTTTPTWTHSCDDAGICDVGDMKSPASIVKVPLDADSGTPSVVANLPPELAFDKNQIFFGKTNFISDAFPIGWSTPLALRGDKSLLVGNQGSRAIYTVSSDGQSVEKFSDMPTLAASAILAPNDVVYLVSNVLTDQTCTNIAVKPMIQAYDGQKWSTVVEIDGYEQRMDALSSLIMSAPCMAGGDDAGTCGLPLGIFPKIEFDSANNLIYADPVNESLTAYHLTFLSETDGGSN